jgi:hypothetical protein
MAVFTWFIQSNEASTWPCNKKSLGDDKYTTAVAVIEGQRRTVSDLMDVTSYEEKENKNIATR